VFPIGWFSRLCYSPLTVKGRGNSLSGRLRRARAGTWSILTPIEAVLRRVLLACYPYALRLFSVVIVLLLSCRVLGSRRVVGSRITVAFRMLSACFKEGKPEGPIAGGVIEASGNV
jgi:hypothetical protein